jgi:probable rRNA maturation factor
MPRATDLALTVQYATTRRGLPAVPSLRKWALSALRGAGAEITVRFVGRREGRALNRTYRGRDYATNVLSFPYEAREPRGDLVLCAPVIASEARAQGKRLRDHYAHLIVHGILHLQGWDHQDDTAASKMERREIAILSILGIADPYRARE